MSGENLTIEQVNEIVGDDITYWLGNRFMPPELLAEKVCWWVTIARTPTPEPSEAAETTAGEREGCHVGYPYCDGRRPCACPCHDPAEPGAGEVHLWDDERYRSLVGYLRHSIPAGQAVADLDALIAAHVSAAETKARADERERIAQAIEATVNTWRVEADDDERWLNGNRVSASEAQELPALIRQARTHIREITNAASIARGDAR